LSTRHPARWQPVNAMASPKHFPPSSSRARKLERLAQFDNPTQRYSFDEHHETCFVLDIVLDSDRQDVESIDRRGTPRRDCGHGAISCLSYLTSGSCSVAYCNRLH